MPYLRSYNELLIIPDGPLHKVPFSALYDPEKKTPLLLHHTISYGASIATQEHLQKPATIDYKPGTLLLIANPQAEQINTLLDDKTPTIRSGTLRSLPYAEKEAKAVIRFWQKHGNIYSLLGKAATKKAIYNLPLKQYEVLHFATHALVNWDYPSLSAISLAADSNQQDSLRSKDLTVQDISQWYINSELVILSGCDTASGKTALGEGPLGLSRAFFEAGSKRVIASIWPVEDEASAFLIESFYQELFINGQSPAEALRQARLRLSEIPKWSHPYYWAGFLFLGNGEHWREF